MHDKQSRKCDIYVESKITKKTCHFVEHQTKLLGLVHTNDVDNVCILNLEMVIVSL